MSALTKVFYDTMAEDDILASLITNFAGFPAVFTTEPVPADAVLPYIVTPGESTVLQFETKSHGGREVFRDIRCYAEASGSAVIVEAMAERVRELFHRQVIPVTGFDTVSVEVVDGPLALDQDGIYGRIMTIRLLLEDNL